MEWKFHLSAINLLETLLVGECIHITLWVQFIHERNKPNISNIRLPLILIISILKKKKILLPLLQFTLKFFVLMFFPIFLFFATNWTEKLSSWELKNLKRKDKSCARDTFKCITLCLITPHIIPNTETVFNVPCTYYCDFTSTVLWSDKRKKKGEMGYYSSPLSLSLLTLVTKHISHLDPLSLKSHLNPLFFPPLIFFNCLQLKKTYYNSRILYLLL